MITVFEAESQQPAHSTSPWTSTSHEVEDVQLDTPAATLRIERAPSR